MQNAKIPITYPEYLPTWDKVWYDPLPPFHFEDPTLRIRDKSKPNLLTSNITISDIQPRMGNVVHGIQLNKLTDVQMDELALLVSERKVLAFADQDLIDEGPGA